MNADAYLLTIPAPTGWITENQRHHWAAKARLTQVWRARAAWAARAARIPRIDVPVRIVATVHRDHNRGRWDPTNWSPTAKAAIDGLVDAGVLADDSTRFVTGPDMRAGEPWDGAALVLTIHTIDRRTA